MLKLPIIMVLAFFPFINGCLKSNDGSTFYQLNTDYSIEVRTGEIGNFKHIVVFDNFDQNGIGRIQLDGNSYSVQDSIQLSSDSIIMPIKIEQLGWDPCPNCVLDISDLKVYVNIVGSISTRQIVFLPKP